MGEFPTDLPIEPSNIRLTNVHTRAFTTNSVHREIIGTREERLNIFVQLTRSRERSGRNPRFWGRAVILRSASGFALTFFKPGKWSGC